MKNQFLTIMAVAALVCGCNSVSKYKISGTIEGLTGKLYLMLDNQKLDSVEVTDGTFLFEGSVAEPDFAYFATEQQQMGSFFIENAELTVSGVISEPHDLLVVGSKANEIVNEFNAQQSGLIAQYYADSTSDERKSEIIEQNKAMIQVLIDSNLDNIVGAYFFNQNSYEMESEQIEAAVAKFSTQMQENKFIKEALEKAAVMKKSAVGQPYINVEMPDSTGTMLSLSSYVGEGKYVLLDFWASWCSPCMGEMPYLVEAYNQFHDKGFEIFGVSIDNDRAAWQGAIADHKLTWVHTSLLEGWDNSAVKAYGVRGIPANVLISPEGVIIAKNLRGEKLQIKLTELLGK